MKYVRVRGYNRVHVRVLTALRTARRVSPASRSRGESTATRHSGARATEGPRGLWDWPAGQQRTSCSSRTLIMMWCARSTCAPADSMRATRTERRATSGWMDVAYSAETDTLFVGTWHHTDNSYSACVRSRTQTTVGFSDTECNSRSGNDRISFAARSARRESVRLGVCIWCSSRVPRADRPVDSELHSTRTAGKYTGGSTCSSPTTGFGWPPLFRQPVGGALSCGRRAQRAAAIERPAFRCLLPLFCGDTLLVEKWIRFHQRDSVVLYSGRPPAARPPAYSTRPAASYFPAGGSWMRHSSSRHEF